MGKTDDGSYYDATAKRRIYPKVSPQKSIPSPPKNLNREAKAEWKRITQELWDLGVIANLDRAVLTIYCQTWSMNQAAMDDIALQGFTLVDANGKTYKNPSLAIYKETATQLKSYTDKLGLNPQSRNKLPQNPRNNEDDDSSLA